MCVTINRGDETENSEAISSSPTSGECVSFSLLGDLFSLSAACWRGFHGRIFFHPFLSNSPTETVWECISVRVWECVSVLVCYKHFATPAKTSLNTCMWPITFTFTFTNCIYFFVLVREKENVLLSICPSVSPSVHSSIRQSICPSIHYSTSMKHTNESANKHSYF